MLHDEKKLKKCRENFAGTLKKCKLQEKIEILKGTKKNEVKMVKIDLNKNKIQ